MQWSNYTQAVEQNKINKQILGPRVSQKLCRVDKRNRQMTERGVGMVVIKRVATCSQGGARDTMDPSSEVDWVSDCRKACLYDY